MIGAILQPTYLPWLGYFEMINAAEIFVVYDHVQFVKKTWHHRNRIKGPNGEIRLSIPTKKAPRATAIYQIELAAEYEKSLSDHWVTIAHAYKKSPYFNNYSETLESLFLAKYSSLSDLTVVFIRYFCAQLGITTPFVKSSNILLDKSLTDPTEKVIEICQKANISSLYDANGAQGIIDTRIFYRNKINISFQNYNHPVYPQLFGEFLPYMSILDLMLNVGPNSLAVINKGRCNPIQITNN